jgi:hypothetical protein
MAMKHKYLLIEFETDNSSPGCESVAVLDLFTHVMLAVTLRESEFRQICDEVQLG